MEKKEVRTTLINRVFNRLIPSFLLRSNDFPPINPAGGISTQQFMQLGGPVTQVSPWDALRNIRRGYMGQPDVYAVIRMIAKTAAGVPLYVYNIIDDKAYHELKNLAASYEKYGPEYMQAYKYYHTKAYEIAGDNDPLQKLIDRPNDQDEKQEFYTGSYIYKLSTGNFMIYLAIIPEGVNGGRLEGLYNMPVQSMTVVGAGGFPRRVTSYEMHAETQMIFPPETVMHSKYFNPDWSNSAGNLIGLSPLMALTSELELDGLGSLAEINQYVFGGPKVIVGLDEILPDELGLKQIAQVREEFTREKEGAKNAGKWSILAGKINVHNVGATLVDMDLVKRKTITKERIAAIYGINPVILGASNASTESNVKQAVKQLYTNACLPEVYAMRDSMNRKITPRYQDGRYKKTIDCDISGITELQPDFKLLADTFNSMPVFKPNDLLEAFKYGRSDDSNMDKYYIKSGYTTIDDLNLQLPDITNTSDYTGQ